jgi:hypothetical protein
VGRRLILGGLCNLTFPYINSAPYFFSRIDDSPKAAMLSPYRCQCISLVSGLRSECSSSSIGSSGALCSLRRAVYQKLARLPLFYPAMAPPPRAWRPEGREGWAWECREDRASSARIAVPSSSIASLPPSRRTQSPSVDSGSRTMSDDDLDRLRTNFL